MSEIEKLAQYFARFPGIGTRQAKRFVYFLLSSNPQFTKELSARIVALFEKTAQCYECRRYFEIQTPARNAICSFCKDTTADKTRLLVVEKDIDLENIQKSMVYKGRFFVLGSLIPLAEIKSKTVLPRIDELCKKIERGAIESKLSEVILALSANPEGDHTALELKTLLKPLGEKYRITISTLGRGLSTGSELEYSDSDTIRYALENRKS